ncbi:unnamed protein product [Moneuplotes crassus]|uniref:EamA domain-containing protein n=1 Tax=Euplotes crassus TaxID=5936 RepID=A0AAD1ULU7_EUPCR|nr:unnamed protein product [Moneuplotes crassus]
MLFVILSFVGTSLIIKLSFSSNDEEEAASFNKPLFTSYTACASFSLYSIRIIYEFIFRSKCRWKDMSRREMTKVELKTALLCFPIFFGSITLYYFSLSLTTYSSTMILGNISSVFVFIFAILILGHAFCFIKCGATITCVVGVLIIALSDKEDFQAANPILGDLLAVCSSLTLGLYSTLLAKLVPPKIENEVSFSNILAFIGLLCLLTLWPLLIIFHFSGLEPFELPKGITIAYLIINIIFGTLLFDYCWGRAILLIGPLVSNTSVLLVVPLSIIIDNLFIKSSFSWQYYLGTIFIVVGFLISAYMNYLDSQNIQDEDSHDSLTSPLNRKHTGKFGQSDEIESGSDNSAHSSD